jgi:hypothetical protein
LNKYVDRKLESNRSNSIPYSISFFKLKHCKGGKSDKINTSGHIDIMKPQKREHIINNQFLDLRFDEQQKGI